MLVFVFSVFRFFFLSRMMSKLLVLLFSYFLSLSQFLLQLVKAVVDYLNILGDIAMI